MSRRTRKKMIVTEEQGLCDLQSGQITCDNALGIENDLVHKTYDNIADHFSETRYKPWPKIKEFVERLSPGDRLLDVGCANGKYFGLNKDILEVGNDMCNALLMKCREKGNEVVRANALSLPFQDNSFEAVISIAVLHHIATKERRIRFLEEILRVLSPQGLALICVWSKEQTVDEKQSTFSKRQSERKPLMPPELDAQQTAYSFLPVYERNAGFPKNDMLVPWTTGQDKQASTQFRFYHVFSQGELEALVMELPSPPTIVDKYYEQGNWAVVLRK